MLKIIYIIMAKKYNEKKLQEEGVLEFKTDFYRLNDERSQAWINVPYPAVKKANWEKDTLLDVSIKKSEEEKEE